MNKKGDEKTTLYVIFILMLILLVVYILYKIIQTKVVGGVFGGI